MTTRTQLQKIITDTFDKINELDQSKGREYASDADALANFHNRAQQMGISPMQVWGIFYGKHSDAIYAYIRNGKVLSEPIEGRINDAILYLILLKGLVREGELEPKGHASVAEYHKSLKPEPVKTPDELKAEIQAAAYALRAMRAGIRAQTSPGKWKPLAPHSQPDIARIQAEAQKERK
jgi:hypothetical protein